MQDADVHNRQTTYSTILYHRRLRIICIRAYSGYSLPTISQHTAARLPEKGMKDSHYDDDDDNGDDGYGYQRMILPQWPSHEDHHIHPRRRPRYPSPSLSVLIAPSSSSSSSSLTGQICQLSQNKLSTVTCQQRAKQPE
ncbi:hypothetical protein V491_03081 [Pseudogymnoascus sp. VKM F-3775]|nr:hypothetical protein V491_03081 [Pseudogymnoascus sp. VKM F-3775]